MSSSLFLHLPANEDFNRREVYLNVTDISAVELDDDEPLTWRVQMKTNDVVYHVGFEEVKNFRHFFDTAQRL